MLLILVLVLIAILLAMFLVAAVSVVGSGVLIIFGDVIVCGVFIGWIIRRLCKKRKAKKD